MQKNGLAIMGFCAGLLSAALGIGGGIILVPALILFFNFPVKKAMGTSLASMVPKVGFGLLTYIFLNGSRLNTEVALFAILGSIFGAWIGVKIEKHIKSKVLSTMFVVLMLVVALEILGLIHFQPAAVEKVSYIGLILLGLAAGIASSLFGVGGGIILVPGFTMLFGLSFHQAIPTSLAVILPTVFLGSYLQNKVHHVDKNAIKVIIPFSITGAILGAIASKQASPILLEYLFGLILIIASLKIFLTKHSSKHISS